jgi:hypothetical protein
VARNDKTPVIPDSAAVIPDLIRDPVLRHHWIAGAETPDLIRGRNDNPVRKIRLMGRSAQRVFGVRASAVRSKPEQNQLVSEG